MKNILFIMADQLRHDYLGCAGHRSLRTPHIDAHAARGVRFADANVQSPVCGPSRICMYIPRSRLALQSDSAVKPDGHRRRHHASGRRPTIHEFS